jgi:hypothetical protein
VEIRQHELTPYPGNGPCVFHSRSAFEPHSRGSTPIVLPNYE